MHKKLKELEEKILECTKSKIEECGLENLETEELGQAVDMIKDLSEARYYDAVVEAMDVPDPEEARRMGYDRWRYASGEYAPKGRGHYSPGYTHMMDEPREFPGYTDVRYNGSYPDQYNAGASTRSDGRMGYPMDSGTYGRSYAEYRDRRKNYTENPIHENKQMMEESAERHLEEAIDSLKEMWRDVDQPMRVKIKDKLTRTINDMA